MLNCGMYQSDISELKHRELDWEAGTITRKRSKTKGHKGVPTVTHPLWPQTSDLLRKYRTTHGDRVLLNARSGPLVNHDLSEDGKLRKCDAIKNAYDRLKKKTTINKPLKLFRKRSADLVGKNEEYRGLEDLFLGLIRRVVELTVKKATLTSSRCCQNGVVKPGSPSQTIA